MDIFGYIYIYIWCYDYILLDIIAPFRDQNIWHNACTLLPSQEGLQLQVILLMEIVYDLAFV